MERYLLGVLFAATYVADALRAPLVGIGAAVVASVLVRWLGVFSPAQAVLLPLALGCLVTAALLRD